MASWSVLAAVDGLLLRGCVVACETDRSAQTKGVEYLTRFVHTLPLADTPLAAPRACCVAKMNPKFSLTVRRPTCTHELLVYL